MNRRSFLAWLGGTAAGAALAPTLDLDKLLWVPGEKRIFVLSPRRFVVADKKLGISIRYIQRYDIVPDANPGRIDVWMPRPVMTALLGVS